MIRQIVDIFVPEHSGANYILSTTVLAVTLKEDKVVGTVLPLNGTSITVQNVIEEAFQEGKGTQQSKAAALTALIKKAGSYDKLITTLESSSVLFKKLTLPFDDPDKIRMVLPYEVEALLPFSVHEAALDFLITHKDPASSSSEVLVGAVQKKLIEEHLKPFAQAGLDVEDVTVDAIGLYSLYTRQNQSLQKGNTALVDIGTETTKIIFFTNKVLKHIRTLREGFSSTDNKSLWDKVNFTLQAFADENAQDQKIKKVTVIGLKDKASFDEAHAEIAFPCEPFSIKKFFDTSKITLNVKEGALFLPGFIGALPLPDGRFFTLEPNRLTKAAASRLNRQTITALILSIGTIALLAGHTIKEIQKLSVELEKSQKEVLHTIKKNFPSLKTNSRRDAIDLAKREVRREENIWSSFSAQTRQSFLKSLYDLSTKIDRETLGLNLKKMVLNKKFIALEGSVRSFDAVEQFEQQLKETKLFSKVPDMQKVDFSVQLELETKGAL